MAFQFVSAPNCPEILERSTDLRAWTPVSSITATNAQATSLQDANPPSVQAFYRLRLVLPQ